MTTHYVVNRESSRLPTYSQLLLKLNKSCHIHHLLLCAQFGAELEMLLVRLPTAWWNYQVPQKETEREKESAGLLQKSSNE